MSDEDLYIRDHVIAVTRLLLGNRKLKDGVVVTGGKVLALERKLALGQTVAASGADLIHLEFDHDDCGAYRLHSLLLMAPRDGIVYVKSDCQLWLSRTGKRALVLPPPGHLGAFRLAPAEIVQVVQRPTDEAAGQARAHDRLAKLVAGGSGQASGFSVSYAQAA